MIASNRIKANKEIMFLIEEEGNINTRKWAVRSVVKTIQGGKTQVEIPTW